MRGIVEWFAFLTDGMRIVIPLAISEQQALHKDSLTFAPRVKAPFVLPDVAKLLNLPADVLL